MAFDLKQEKDVKEFIENLGIEYRFGCYHERKPEVCHLLGDYLESVKKDHEKAGKVYKTNCDDFNYGKSCFKFGNYTLIGKGHQPENPDVAFKYYKRGCELNEVDACLNAGLMCVTTSPQSKHLKDYPQGMALLEKGCASNHPFCCYYISGIYISGVKEANIQKNMEKAFDYSKKACDLGNMYACANVSQMYRKGEGVGKDDTLSEQYKKKALEMQDEVKKQTAQLQFQQGAKQT